MFIKHPTEDEYKYFTKQNSANESLTLPYGKYTIDLVGMLIPEPCFVKSSIKEKLVEPLSSESYKLLKKSVLKFYDPDLRELYKDLEYLNKKGILYHGKPGTGKTASINYLLEKTAIENKAIVLQVNNVTTLEMLPHIIDMIRKDAKEEIPISIIIDECENYFTAHHPENTLLNFLDGYSSRNNVLCIFITNKLDKIPDRFTKRPSRIRDLIEFNVTPYEVLQEILLAKIPEKYHKVINIEKLAYKYSEEGKTIDEAKTKTIELLEDSIIEQSALVSSVKETLAHK